MGPEEGAVGAVQDTDGGDVVVGPRPHVGADDQVRNVVSRVVQRSWDAGEEG